VADSLDGSDKSGTLKPGMLADIIAVASNPLDGIRVMERTRFVMKGEKVFERPRGRPAWLEGPTDRRGAVWNLAH
jgi:imidazolonepropionase-like amidohydrolase